MSDIVSKKTVDEILEEINQIDINKIELDPKAQKFLKTVEGYLNCFDELECLYKEVDPGHQLANYDMPDIKHDIQQMEGLLGQVTSSGTRPESPRPKFELPPGEDKFKGKQRASEKAQDNYSTKVPGPPESWLYDIVRGSVLFHGAEQLFQFLELVRADKSIVIVKSKNRFRNPTLSGYRDFNLQIEITNDDDDEDKIDTIKHIREL